MILDIFAWAVLVVVGGCGITLFFFLVVSSILEAWDNPGSRMFWSTFLWVAGFALTVWALFRVLR